MTKDIIIPFLGKKKKTRTPEEKAAILKQIKQDEKDFDFRPKLNGCVFEYWIYIQVKRAENRYFEARMKNIEGWALERIMRDNQNMRQLQINWGAEYKLPLLETTEF